MEAKESTESSACPTKEIILFSSSHCLSSQMLHKLSWETQSTLRGHTKVSFMVHESCTVPQFEFAFEKKCPLR